VFKGRTGTVLVDAMISVFEIETFSSERTEKGVELDILGALDAVSGDEVPGSFPASMRTRCLSHVERICQLRGK
jgi:hypothetical protein